MVGTFELFHLSLIERDQGDLFVNQMTREAWLKHTLDSAFIFSHREKDFHWVPVDTGSHLIAGNVARTHKRVHHTPPEDGAIEVVSDEWQGSLVILDPSHHQDGQKLSFERDQTVGRPRAVLQSLLTAVNMRTDAPYAIEPKPIFNKASFWSWSAAHENKVRRIAFEFVVPNMWGSASDLDEELKALGAIGVQKAKTAFESPDGIDTTAKPIKEAIEYAAKGAGSVTAKAQNGDTYASTDDAATVKLPP